MLFLPSKPCNGVEHHVTMAAAVIVRGKSRNRAGSQGCIELSGTKALFVCDSVSASDCFCVS